MPRPKNFDPDAALDAVLDEFWCAGYTHASTEELCAASGLSRSSLYNTFGSKRALFLSALRRYIATKQDQRARLSTADGTGRAALEELMTTVLDEQWSDSGHRSCLMINAAMELGRDDQEIADLLEDNARDFSTTLSQIIGRGQSDGSITHPARADDLAAMAHALLDGLQVRGRIAHDRSSIDRTVHAVLDLLSTP